MASNIPQTPLRWDLHGAAREWDLTTDTLKKRLIAAEQSPDLEDKTYSTGQITEAIFTSSKRLRDLETLERTRNWRLKNEVLEGELLDRSSVIAGLESLFIAIVQIINSSDGLTKKDKEDILDNIANYPILIEKVAKKQSSKQANEENPKE